MNIGIAGLGRMGSNHLRVLNSLKDSIINISVYDADNKVMNEMSKIYDVRCHGSIDHLIDFADAVIICTPTATHYTIAKKCIDKGKDILIEKPVTSTADEALDLMEQVKDKNIICMVGHVERFNPAVLYLKQYLKDKKIRSVSANRISKLEPGRVFDVDAVTDLMIHDIDIILSMLDSEPLHLFALSNDNTIDTVSALLQFADGVTASLTTSRSSQEKVRSLDIAAVGENIHLDYIKNRLEIVRQYDIELPLSQNNTYRLVEKREILYFEGEPLKLELQHFIDCIISRKRPLSNEETGYNALGVAKSILCSIPQQID